MLDRNHHYLLHTISKIVDFNINIENVKKAISRMSSETKKHKKQKKSKHTDEECEQKEVDTKLVASVSDADESLRKKHKKSKKSKRTEDEMNEALESTTFPAEVEEESHTKHKKSKNEKSRSQSENEADKPEESKSTPKEFIPEVHTANSWEKVDLGDDQRKLKFLKLMGAGKHQDKDSDKNIKSRALRDNKKVEEDLEKQFTKGLTSKMLNPKHQGLGASNRPEPQNVRKTFSDSDNEKCDAAAVEKLDPIKKTEPTAQYSGFNAAAEARLKFKKMSFVKSSS